MMPARPAGTARPGPRAWTGRTSPGGGAAGGPPVAGAELLRLPVVERLVGGPGQRVWCFDCVTEFAEDSGGFLGHVPHNGGSLAAPPPFTTCFDVLAPSRFEVEFALADQELDEIFQARAEPGGVKPQVSTGAPPGTRTPNPRIKSPLLCQLS